MKRKIYEKLVEWKHNSADRYALLIEGARRVGKSYIVREFAQKEYASHLILDFAVVGKDIQRLFEEKLSNLDEFFMLLQLRTGVTLIHGNALVVFDEVQRFPRAREAIKYLVADGRYHYIETGSLISIKRNVEKIVIPSEEIRLQMYPLDFEEFLWAMGRQPVMALMRRRFAERQALGQVDHRLVMELFRQYVVVGGMPQAVLPFAQSRDLPAVETAKRAILGLYGEDIGKFAGRLKTKVRAIWQAIPGELSRHEKRFSPSSINDGVRMRELDAPFEWLEESMTVNVARNVADPNVGLRLTEERMALKCYMGDTGLLVSHAFSENELAAEGILNRLLTDSLGVNRGMLMENVVAQMLRASGQGLFFHANGGKDDSSRMEIDFLMTKSKVTRRRNLFPIEVKSARDYKTSSLEKFRRKFRENTAKAIVLHPSDLKSTDDILYFPLYMAGLLCELKV